MHLAYNTFLAKECYNLHYRGKYGSPWFGREDGNNGTLGSMGLNQKNKESPQNSKEINKSDIQNDNLTNIADNEQIAADRFFNGMVDLSGDATRFLNIVDK